MKITYKSAWDADRGFDLLIKTPPEVGAPGDKQRADEVRGSRGGTVARRPEGREAL